MGLMVDTNVFIKFEKGGKAIDLSPWEQSETVYASVVTVSELIIGVHRADTAERRKRRSIFVEAVISGIDVLNFTVDAARIHAEIYAELAKKGKMIGAHDLIIAATACCHDLSILTDNVDEFSRLPGLRVIPFLLLVQQVGSAKPPPALQDGCERCPPRRILNAPLNSPRRVGIPAGRARRCRSHHP